MKQTLTLSDLRSMIDASLVAVREREAEFSQLDAVLGDGDHGQAIVTAMSVVADKAAEGKAFRSMLGDMGMEVLMQVSGSTSTLLGALLLGMSDGTDEVDEIDLAGVKRMFASALKNVQMQTKAQVGDKTMMDALVPAVEAIGGYEGEDVSELMAVAAEAAVKGAEATVGMQARFGRARNYGERSVGVMDSGAASWSTIFKAFAESISNN